MQDPLDELAALSNAGRLSEAIARGEAMLRAQPHSFAIHILLGSAYARAGRLDKADESYAHAARLAPENADVFNNWGVVLGQMGRLEEAVQRFETAAAIAPGLADAHYNLGIALADLGRTEQAIESLQRAVALKSDFAEAYNNLGSALAELRRLDEAVDAYSSALKIDPAFSSACNNLGNALLRLGRREEAIDCFARAIREAPDSAQAYYNLGLALAEAGRLEESIQSYTRALSLAPNFADAHCSLGVALAELRRFEEAIACFRRALQVKPGFALARAQKMHYQAVICEWYSVGADADAGALLGVEGGVVPPFMMLSIEDDPARHRIRSERFARHEYPRTARRPAPPEIRPKRLRLGYFSADFHEHATMHLAAKLFEAHDRDRFVVHGFSYGPNRDDSMRRRVSSAFDSFHDISALGNAEAAVLARRENIDIAIDLTGNTSRSRSAIFAHRPAPIQINYLGFPGTMGAEFFDYIVADTTVIPEDQQGQFTERVMYLPHCCYVNDNTREISDRSMSRAEAGLPDRAFVFCCFNAPYKITPAEWDIWMRLLGRVQGSVLWLRGPGERAVTNLRREALKRGIAADRLIFAEPLAMPEHLARHRLADLFLDTFNYNAHSTASDALWAGLPILTKAGRGFPTRVAASHLNALGLPELVVDSEPAYERLALELATSLEKLSGIRQKLNANRLSAPLFNTELFVRHFEDACEQVYQGYFEGKRPETVTIRSEP